MWFKIKGEGLSNIQYWVVILIAIIFLSLNGYLILQLLNNEVNWDIVCPLPVGKIDRCECKYVDYGKEIEFCQCYPFGSNLTTKIPKSYNLTWDSGLQNLTIVKNIENLTIVKKNLTIVKNLTGDENVTG